MCLVAQALWLCNTELALSILVGNEPTGVDGRGSGGKLCGFSNTRKIPKSDCSKEHGLWDDFKASYCAIHNLS